MGVELECCIWRWILRSSAGFRFSQARGRGAAPRGAAAPHQQRPALVLQPQRVGEALLQVHLSAGAVRIPGRSAVGPRSAGRAVGACRPCKAARGSRGLRARAPNHPGRPSSPPLSPSLSKPGPPENSEPATPKPPPTRLQLVPPRLEALGQLPQGGREGGCLWVQVAHKRLPHVRLGVGWGAVWVEGGWGRLRGLAWLGLSGLGSGFCGANPPGNGPSRNPKSASARPSQPASQPARRKPTPRGGPGRGPHLNRDAAPPPARVPAEAGLAHPRQLPRERLPHGRGPGLRHLVAPGEEGGDDGEEPLAGVGHELGPDLCGGVVVGGLSVGKLVGC